MVGVHFLGIAAIGGMTLAVMMRASMGHTGRPLEAGPLLTVSFALIPPPPSSACSLAPRFRP